jgi:hypothetical protein
MHPALKHGGRMRRGHPHDLHPAQERVIDDLQRGLLGQCLVEVEVESVPFAVDDAALQPVEQGQGRELLGLARRGGTRLDALEELEESLEGVVRDRAIL